MSADIVIKGGTVHDGTGADGVVADLAITDGRITEVAIGLDGRRRIDADGLVVAPGFVDLHTHYDAQVLWDSALTPSSWHGVTTVVAGNCGFSLAPCRPEHHDLMARTLEHVEAMTLEALDAGIDWDFASFPEYLDAVARRGVVLNYGQLVGHTAVRLFAMGDAGYDRAATDEEISDMCRVVGEALDAGALGFSTSLVSSHQGEGGRPVPSRQSTHAEVAALAGVVDVAGAGIVQIAPGPQFSLDDVFALAVDHSGPIIFSELLTRPDGLHWRRLAALDDARAGGATDLWGLIAVRPLVFQFHLRDPFPFNSIPEFAELLGLPDEERRRRFADESWRRTVGAKVRDGALRWESTYFDETDVDDVRGRSVADVAAGRGVDPLDAMLDIALVDDLRTRLRVVLLNDDQESIDRLLGHESLVVGLSDAGAHASQLCDAGFATELLGTYVRERAALSLAEGIRKLTSEPAAVLGLTDRGVLRPGAAADVVVFDPATVAPGPLRRVWDFPAGTDRLVADEPVGVEHVLVNGVPIRRSGRPVDEGVGRRPGRVLGRA